MIKEVTRSHIAVELDGRSATIPGEMFFPSDGKLGFVVYVREIKHWDYPFQNIEVTGAQLETIIEEIRSEFQKGGHTLALE